MPTQSLLWIIFHLNCTSFPVCVCVHPSPLYTCPGKPLAARARCNAGAMACATIIARQQPNLTKFAEILQGHPTANQMSATTQRQLYLSWVPTTQPLTSCPLCVSAGSFCFFFLVAISPSGLLAKRGLICTCSGVCLCMCGKADDVWWPVVQCTFSQWSEEKDEKNNNTLNELKTKTGRSNLSSLVSFSFSSLRLVCPFVCVCDLFIPPPERREDAEGAHDYEIAHITLWNAPLPK